MKLREMLESPFGKAQVARVVRHIGTDSRLFRELLGLFGDPDRQIAARASWCLTHITGEHSSLVASSLKKLAGLLGSTGNSSIDRNILHALQELPVPPPLEAAVFDYCLKAITTPDEPIAVRAFATTVAAKIAVRHPDLATELKLVIDDLKQHSQSPAMRVRIRNALKVL